MTTNPTLKVGQVRVYQGKKRALALVIGLWAEKRKKTSPIHIHITGTSRFHTTVTNRPGSQRHHRTLFRNLRYLLVEHGRWPFENE